PAAGVSRRTPTAPGSAPRGRRARRPRRSGPGRVRLVARDAGELLRVEARAADERAVDVGLRHDRGDVRGLHRAAVEDAGRVREVRVVEVAQGAADRAADLLRVLGRRDLARADGPHGLVGDDERRELRGGETRERALDLRERVGDLLARLADVQTLAHADDRGDALTHGGDDLLVDQRDRLAVVLAALGVADRDVAHAELGEHRRRDLAGVRALGVRRDVL